MTTPPTAGDHPTDQAFPCATQQTGLLFGHMSDLLSANSQLLDNSETDRAEILDRLLDSGEIQRRIRAALGPRADPTIIQNLEAIYTAALFDAATGYAADSGGDRSPEQLVQRILDRR